jgi:hypothetical protein
MPDSQLNGAERHLQQSFRKMFAFNGLLVGVFVLLAYLPIGKLPDRRARPVAVEMLSIQPVELPAPAAPLTLAGAWVLNASDPRFAGLSGLALDQGRFLAVSDLGAVIRFDRPHSSKPKAHIQDLRIGPGPFGGKFSRDAESLARDPLGRGWWVGFERHHSLWLFGADFNRALARVDLSSFNWSDNRGAEGLLVQGGQLLALAENGRDAVRIDDSGLTLLELQADGDVAEAATAPDGSAWLLLRREGMSGISEWIAPLLPSRDGFMAGPAWRLPKGEFDNYEGMAIEQLPDGHWRFWLVTDDGHRVMARTLLVALDYLPPAHSKSPATSAGPSNNRL